MAYFFPLHGKNGQLHGIYMALHEKQAITWQNHVTWQKGELCMMILAYQPSIEGWEEAMTPFVMMLQEMPE